MSHLPVPLKLLENKILSMSKHISLLFYTANKYTTARNLDLGNTKEQMEEF